MNLQGKKMIYLILINRELSNCVWNGIWVASRL